MIGDDISECKHQKKAPVAKSFLPWISIHKLVDKNSIALEILIKINGATMLLFPANFCLFYYFALTCTLLLTNTIIVSTIIILSMSSDSYFYEFIFRSSESELQKEKRVSFEHKKAPQTLYT